jgi:hypothetical protein
LHKLYTVSQSTKFLWIINKFYEILTTWITRRKWLIYSQEINKKNYFLVNNTGRISYKTDVFFTKLSNILIIKILENFTYYYFLLVFLYFLYLIENRIQFFQKYLYFSYIKYLSVDERRKEEKLKIPTANTSKYNNSIIMQCLRNLEDLRLQRSRATIITTTETSATANRKPDTLCKTCNRYFLGERGLNIHKRSCDKKNRTQTVQQWSV